MDARIVRILTVLSILTNLAAQGSAADTLTVHLLADSLANYPYYLPDTWLYAPGDDTLRARKAFDDSQWIAGKTTIDQTDSLGKLFPGIGWFRLHIFLDTSLLNKPLAISMTHYGASEVYFDGRL